MYKVSVLIPLYNQEQLIKKCIESIPVRDDIEIIVVDDGSSDNGFNVVQSYKNVKVFKNNKNLGIGLTRNILIEKATGEYIFFLDSDDFVYTDAFIKVLDNLNNIDVMEVVHKQNNGHTWYSRVYRGAFIKASIAKSIEVPNMRCHEDTYWKKSINIKYPNLQVCKSNELVYHYNFPRDGSLIDTDRKNKKSSFIQFRENKLKEQKSDKKNIKFRSFVNMMQSMQDENLN